MSEEEGKTQIPKPAAYDGAAGGWAALREVVRHLRQQEVLLKGSKTLKSANQPTGFDCPGCAWPDPEHTSSFEYCENGAKAVAWEATDKRAGADLFAQISVSELAAQEGDYWLEAHGRLTHPMQYDPAQDCYVPISWDDAFSIIARHLRGLDDPNQAEFYTSGRTSNEAAFLYQLFVREYGTNNFPDCSNMCHEPTSIGLPKSIGVGKGTVTLADFDEADLIMSIGHNPATNHPRMLGTLRDVAKRGIPIVVLNPLRERGLERYANPQSPFEMATLSATDIASHYFQVRPGGDAAALKGIMKALFAMDAVEGQVLDHIFIAEHTNGFDALKADIDATTWPDIEQISGLTRQQLEEIAKVYASADSAIVCYGMGITQHHSGTDNVRQLANLLLLRGNIGRPGAGICPLRGHSNVQGDRTVGISERPPKVLLDNIQRVCGFTPPRNDGHTVTEALEAMEDGRSKVFVAIGGNVARAASDLAQAERAFRNCDLTVFVLTKPNRGILVHGRESLVLPTIGRTEQDIQGGKAQSITVEDSMSMVHVSTGMNEPPSEHCRSETWIVGEMAKKTLPDSVIDWDRLVADNSEIRDLIAEIVPGFQNFNERVAQPGGFYLGNPARNRVWNTPSGRAEFHVFDGLLEDPACPKDGQLTLTTCRSHDQYNTTIYGMDDRYRGITGRRDVVFLNVEDMAQRGLSTGQRIDIETVCEDSGDYALRNMEAVGFNLPRGTAMAYFPEANALIPRSHYDRQSFTPAYKSIPIIVKATS